MPSQRQSIILGALVSALLGVILSYVAQLNQWAGMLACCIPGIAAGLLAVWHYTDDAGVTLTSGEGAKMGALAGVLGGIISSLLVWILQAIGLLRTTAEQWEIQRQQMLDQGMTPEQVDQAMQFGEAMTGPMGYLFAIGLALLFGALIGAIGGAIGAALFKKGGERPASEV